MKTKTLPVNNIQSQQGYSIIELMVASVIGLVVLSGAITVFSGNKSSQEMSSGMARIQESGRVALDILSNDIRLTGYQGCTNGTITPSVIATVQPTVNLPMEALWGGEFDGTDWSPAEHTDLSAIKNSPKAGSDIIYVQHGSGRTALLSTSMTSLSGPISLETNPDQLAEDDLVMISNCSSADIFRASSVSNPTGTSTAVSVGFAAGTDNTQSSLNAIYTVDTGGAMNNPMRVMRFESNAYFVGDSGRDDKNGNDIYSLFVVDTTSPTKPFAAVELVEGVENMQVLYGERLDTGAIRYLPAGGAGLNMNNVVSIQIGLLVASTNEITTADDDRTYLLADVKVGPPSSTNSVKHDGGRTLRAAFNSTIQLRNRRL